MAKISLQKNFQNYPSFNDTPESQFYSMNIKMNTDFYIIYLILCSNKNN